MLKFRETQITPNAEELTTVELLNAVTSGRITLTDCADLAQKAARVRLGDELEKIGEMNSRFSSMEETLRLLRGMRNTLVERLDHFYRLSNGKPEALTNRSPVVEHARERIAAIDTLFIQAQPHLEEMTKAQVEFLKFPQE